MHILLWITEEIQRVKQSGTNHEMASQNTEREEERTNGNLPRN